MCSHTLNSTSRSSDAVGISGPGGSLLRFGMIEVQLLVWEASCTENRKVDKSNGKEHRTWYTV